MSNQSALTKTDNTALTISQYLNRVDVKKHIESILKDRAPQLITSLISLSNLTPGLAKCDPKTLLYCGMKAASLNLPLDNNLGFAYAVPFTNHKTGVTEAQFIAGYRAFIQLAQRSGQYKKINVIEVKTGELKKWDPFTEELELVLIEDVDKRESLPVIGYAAMFELLNGFSKTSYWPKDRVLKHAKRFSKTFNKGPWQTDFDMMAKKTVIKDLIGKWGPMSIELQEAIKYDQAVIRETEDGTEVPDYIDAQFEAKDDPEPPQNDLQAEFEAHFKKQMEAEGYDMGGAKDATNQ